MAGVTLAYLMQHGEKRPLPGDPGLTGQGRGQAARTGGGHPAVRCHRG